MGERLKITLKLVPLQRQRFCGQRINGQEIHKDIWVGKRLTVNAFKWADSAIERFEQTWDPTKTTLKRATFNFVITGYVPYSIPIPSIEAWLRVNGVDVGHGGWAPWTSGTSASGTVDVTSFFRNGWNTLEAQLNGYFLTLECAVVISAEFVFEYEGEAPPPPKTEKEKQMEEIMTYVKWGAIGVVAVVGVYLGIRAIEARKKG